MRHSTTKLVAGSIAVFMALFIGFIFRAEISEAWNAHLTGEYSGDVLSRNTHLLPITDTDQIRDFVLGDQKSAIPAARVIYQRLKGRQGDLIAVACDLQSTSLNTTYPSLKVVMFDVNDQVLRTFVLSNTEYQHGSTLSLERIFVNVHALPGEVRLTTQAFYPAT